MGIFSSGQKPLASRFNAIANSAGINNVTGAGTTTSASYGNVAATSSFSFAKIRDDTAVRIDMNLAMYSTGGTGEVRIGVLINGTDYDVFNRPLSTTDVWGTIAGTNRITGITAGTYTIQARWKRVSGAGTLTTNANGWISLQATEVQ